jgi:hypothetical protein
VLQKPAKLHACPGSRSAPHRPQHVGNLVTSDGRQGHVGKTSAMVRYSGPMLGTAGTMMGCAVLRYCR